MIVGMNRLLAAELRSRELAASVGDHFVHIHVELSAAAGRPDVQREHVVMLAIEDFVAGLNDQLVGQIVGSFAGVTCFGCRLLQNCVGGDHFARHQVLADAEMLKRTLRLRAAEHIGRDVDLAKAVHLFSNVAHEVAA